MPVIKRKKKSKKSHQIQCDVCYFRKIDYLKCPNCNKKICTSCIRNLLELCKLCPKLHLSCPHCEMPVSNNIENEFLNYPVLLLHAIKLYKEKLSTALEGIVIRNRVLKNINKFYTDIVLEDELMNPKDVFSSEDEEQDEEIDIEECEELTEEGKKNFLKMKLKENIKYMKNERIKN